MLHAAFVGSTYPHARVVSVDVDAARKFPGVRAVIVGADDVVNPKPHPEPVELALRLLGADPGTTVYVGDSVHDMESGRAAGVRTAAALWGPFSRADLERTEPDYWLERPADLLGLIRD